MKRVKRCEGYWMKKAVRLRSKECEICLLQCMYYKEMQGGKCKFTCDDCIATYKEKWKEMIGGHGPNLWRCKRI